jgi:hypothetical protein
MMSRNDKTKHFENKFPHAAVVEFIENLRIPNKIQYDTTDTGNIFIKK